MANLKATDKAAADTTTNSWLAMIVIVLAQIQMAFNVNAIPVSVGVISEEFNTSATTVGTALVVYSLVVAAFVLLGSKLGKLIGVRLVFQVTVLAHGAAMAMMALSTSANMMINAQALAGLAAAALVPTLVVLIANNYHGKRQAQALGILAGSVPIAGALAFFFAGYLATAFSWRYSFGSLAFLSILVFLLSFRLSPVPRQQGVKIDFIGAVLAAVGIILISLGFNNLNSWGVVLAKPAAPIALLGLSPAPMMIVAGVVILQGFLAWSSKREAGGEAALLSLEVLDSRTEHAALITLLIIGATGSAVNFLIPLYIQIVQEQTSLFTAVAIVPYTLSIATAAMLIVRLYDRFTPRLIGMAAFILVSIGLTVLAFTIQNQWGTPLVIFGLILVGLGEGALITLLFNVLVTASRKDLAGDVGALRGVVNNLATAVGTALAGALALGLLTLFVTSRLASANLPEALKVNFDPYSVDFVTNTQLESTLDDFDATPQQVSEAVAINTDARLMALKASFLILGAVTLLAIYPASGLPNYVPGEISAVVEEKPTRRGRKKPAATTST
jgi:MFS family permease